MCDNPEGFNEWILQQPLILQPDIMREFVAVTKELAREKGIELNETDLDGYLEGADKYEEAILNEQVAAVNLEVAQLNRDAVMKDVEEARNGIKEYVRECVETNADNAEPMRQLAKQIMDLEIKDGLYEPEDWAWFQKYL